MTVTFCDRCGEKIDPTKVHRYIYADSIRIIPENDFILKRYTSDIAVEEDVDLCAECENELNVLLNEFFNKED